LILCLAFPLELLREREIVPFHRFGDTLSYIQSHLETDNYCRYNPAFDPKY